MGQQGFQVAFFSVFLPVFRIRDILVRAGSGSSFGSGSSALRQLLSSLATYNIFLKFFCPLPTFSRYIYCTSVFKDNKSLRSHQTAEIIVFRNFLVVDGSILSLIRILRLKNIRILRIRIHAGLIAFPLFFYSTCLVVQISAQCIVHLVSLPSSTVHSYSVTARHLKIFSHWALVCQTPVLGRLLRFFVSTQTLVSARLLSLNAKWTLSLWAVHFRIVTSRPRVLLIPGSGKYRFYLLLHGFFNSIGSS